MIPKMNWELVSPPESQIPTNLYPAEIPPLVQKLLWLRNIRTLEEIDRYLHPKLAHLSDPFEIPQMDKAVERIFQAVDNNEKICIYGDYDVDGVTSVVLLRSILHAYDLDTRHFIPVRSKEGYGLSSAGIKRCLEECCCGKPDLLITVDCGTSSLKEVDWLNEQGIEVMILDHHEGSPLGRPNAIALINPKLDSTQWSYLCSAGVVFKLIHALLKTRKLPDYELKNYLDLVAVGTVADIVPLVDENRLLVRHGLKQLNASRHTGLQMLKEIAGVNSDLNASHVGFRIGPRINAAGRMDSPLDALELLLSGNKEEASKLAKQLDLHNKRRQEEEAGIKAEAVQWLQDKFDPDKDTFSV